MLKNMNLEAAVVGATAYVDNELVARDVNLKLPDLTNMTSDVNASGTFSLPICLLDNMEASITVKGFGTAYTAFLGADGKEIEFRWVQSRLNTAGKIENIGYKAFITGIVATHPGGTVNLAETPENEITINCYYYKLLVDGEEAILINRLTGKQQYNGVDRYADINQKL